MVSYDKNRLYMVPLAEIQADPGQPRQFMEPVALQELTASMTQMGIIQPVVCRQDPATSLVYCVAGTRRCAAAGLAGLAEVPAIFIDGSNRAEVALVENLQRQNLNPVEEAEALQSLMDDHAYPQEQLATAIGKSQASISRFLSINRLPKEIRDKCRQDPTVPKTVLFEIARKKQERSMLTEFRKYQDVRAKIAAKEVAKAMRPPPRRRKRTPVEALVNSIGNLANKIGALEFPDHSAENRAAIIDAMNSMKDALDEAIARAVENKEKIRHLKEL